MQTTILTLATLAATVVADLGQGTIINNCDYEVGMNNVPAQDPVYKPYQTVLAANGGRYSQTWTSLTSGAGWSMKLNPASDSSSIMQFEYTYSVTEPDNLWFDLSYVNGNPFSGHWVLSSSSDACIVKQTAYNNPTDDANGMQVRCTPDVSITVELCPSVEENTGTATPSYASSTTTTTPKSSSTWTSTTSATPTTFSSAAHTTSTTESASPLAASYFDQPTTTSTSSTPTTFATKTTALVTEDNGSVVTELDTVIATKVVTVYGHGPHYKRHVHGHHH